ncbi:hypothetical protein JCM10213_000780 [Rhodosporidiobolus nylandii]
MDDLNSTSATPQPPPGAHEDADGAVAPSPRLDTSTSEDHKHDQPAFVVLASPSHTHTGADEQQGEQHTVTTLKVEPPQEPAPSPSAPTVQAASPAQQSDPTPPTQDSSAQPAGEEGGNRPVEAAAADPHAGKLPSFLQTAPFTRPGFPLVSPYGPPQVQHSLQQPAPSQGQAQRYQLHPTAMSSASQQYNMAPFPAFGAGMVTTAGHPAAVQQGQGPVMGVFSPRVEKVAAEAEGENGAQTGGGAAASALDVLARVTQQGDEAKAPIEEQEETPKPETQEEGVVTRSRLRTRFSGAAAPSAAQKDDDSDEESLAVKAPTPKRRRVETVSTSASAAPPVNPFAYLYPQPLPPGRQTSFQPYGYPQQLPQHYQYAASSAAVSPEEAAVRYAAQMPGFFAAQYGAGAIPALGGAGGGGRFPAGRSQRRDSAGGGSESAPTSPATVPGAGGAYYPSPSHTHSTLATSPTGFAYIPSSSPVAVRPAPVNPQQQPNPALVSSSGAAGGFRFGAVESPLPQQGAEVEEGEAKEKGKGKKKAGRKKADGESYQIQPIAGVKPFITKLRYLLQRPDSFADSICWSESGNEVLIKVGGETRLATEVLPRTYGHENQSALYRQFTSYGFTQIKTPNEVSAILNPPSPTANTPSSSGASPAAEEPQRAPQEWRIYTHLHSAEDHTFAVEEERAAAASTKALKNGVKQDGDGDDEESSEEEDEDQEDTPYWFSRDTIDNVTLLRRLKAKTKGKAAAATAPAAKVQPAVAPLTPSVAPQALQQQQQPQQQPAYAPYGGGGAVNYGMAAPSGAPGLALGGIIPSVAAQQQQQQQQQQAAINGQRAQYIHGGAGLGAAAPATGEALEGTRGRTRFFGGTEVSRLTGMLRDAVEKKEEKKDEAA